MIYGRFEGFFQICRISLVQDKIPLFDYDDLEITANGIHYLKENSTMANVGNMLKEAVDAIANLARILELI